MKREPILFIRGNKERAEEIKHILIDEWGGSNSNRLSFDDADFVYYIDEFGIIICLIGGGTKLNDAIKEGWMKEYVLPEQPRFKPFDKVVVKIKNLNVIWWCDIYSHEDKDYYHFIGNISRNKEDTIVLPYNDETAKLIGTNDEWKGGEE